MLGADLVSLAEKAKQIYWGNIFSYNNELTEEKCAE